MTTPSKLGPAFLTVFGLPFLGMGLFAAFSFLTAANQPVPQRIGAAVFASVFAIIGAGLIFGSLYGYSLQKKQMALELANPTSPWLWRKDWAASRVESRNKNSAIGWWVVAILVNMLSVPVCLLAISKGMTAPNATLIIPAAFEIAGLAVLIAAARATIRFERFGRTYFEMASLPFSPGSGVAGSIHVQLNADAVRSVEVTLSCIRRVVIGSGKEESVQQVPLWEDSKSLSAASLNRDPIGTIIPVSFALPTDAYQTSHDNQRDQLLWMLKVKADVPGVKYSDEFELPVFRTSPSLSAAPTFSGGITTAPFASSTTMSVEPSADVLEPQHHRVSVSESPDGLEFQFPAGRNVGRTILVVSLAAAVSGLLFAMFRIQPEPPKFIFAGVCVLDFFLMLAVIQSALSSIRIVAGNGKISWRRSVLGIGKPHEMQISDVDAILASTSLQQGSSTLYAVVLKSKEGKKYTLVNDIESRQEARWILLQIEKRVGLSLNTQVEVNNSIYGPPPPPDGTLYTAGGTRTTVRTTGNLSQVVGAIIFVAWIGFVASMMLRTTRMRGNRPAASARPLVRTTAMKAASLDEVLSWAPQRQAEELMARAVEHDSDAAKAVSDHATNWVGHIRSDSNLQQLESQGRYSTDLRVRRATADMELTLYGYTKAPETVDLLIGLAKTDAASRPSALYCLGILAGDGIAADRAHQFLLDTARNNSDPTTRQWATEGLSFVGTDDALYELYQIFTNDPSFAVRDRAGCNVSDCGIFERKQRFRFVPKLIDLASDPQGNTQMRNWSFMALREITGENLPADAAAWRNWYRDKGEARRAEFAGLDWWQVRGDD